MKIYKIRIEFINSKSIYTYEETTEDLKQVIARYDKAVDNNNTTNIFNGDKAYIFNNNNIAFIEIEEVD